MTLGQKEVYVVGGYRTPIGKTGGILKNFLPEKLAASIIKAIINKYNLPSEKIDQVILGNVVGPGGNIARVSLLEASLPFHVPGFTIDYQCGSGLAAIIIGANHILAGQADLVIAGGVESTSMAPKRQFNCNDPRFQGNNHFYERAPFSPQQIGDPEIGEGAEKVAYFKNISRETMDKWALTSHHRAQVAKEEGILRDIILPLKKDGKIICNDECIRSNISIKLLKRMPPAFGRNGKITAGNACLKHDGAAGVLLASASALKKFNLKPEARILEKIFMGYDPNYFLLSPIPAINNLLTKAKLSVEKIDAVEINEAFAVKIIACCQEVGLDLDRTNILGGALAYGHPYGASGAIILLHLLRSLNKVHGILGIAAIGAVGGQSTAILIERCV